MRRAADVLVMIVVLSCALAIWESFYAIWLAVSSSGSAGIREVAAGFHDWARNLVPSLTHLRPGIGRPFGTADQIVLAAILVVLVLRVVLRSAWLGASYGNTSEGADSKRGVAGLLFHFFALMGLVAVVAGAATAISAGRVYIGAWLIAAFMVLSALSLAAVHVASGLGGPAVIARTFNDGIFGAAAVVLLCTGGIPQAPFGLIEQCAVLALANSIVGLAISGSAFEGDGSAKVAKGLGFSAAGVIMLLVAVILFSTTGQAR
jgi:hypothetical protein